MTVPPLTSSARRRAAGPLTICALLLAASGCSAKAEHSHTLASYSASLRSESPSGTPAVPLPLQQYMLTGGAYNTVERAITILAQQCMDQHGFHIRLPQPPRAAGFLVDLTIRRYTTVASLEDAELYGFKVPPDEEAGRDPIDAALHDSMTPAEAAALIGSPPAPFGARQRNGCLGVADRRLMGDATAIEFDGLSNSRLISNVNDDPRAVDGPEEEAALASFDECMNAAGYPSITDPRQAPEQFPYSAPVSKSEREAAVAQYHCQESSHVVEAMRSAEAAFESEVIDANPEAFASVKEQLAAVVSRATAIVAGE